MILKIFETFKNINILMYPSFIFLFIFYNYTVLLNYVPNIFINKYLYIKLLIISTSKAIY